MINKYLYDKFIFGLINSEVNLMVKNKISIGAVDLQTQIEKDEHCSVSPILKSKKNSVQKKKSKIKKKTYEIAGTFELDDNGNVTKKSKSIEKISKGRKDKTNQYIVSFIVKAR